MATQTEKIRFSTHPDQYRHIRLSVEGPIARIGINVSEDEGLRTGYKLKLNSYDLSVDIELDDAVNRLRFEHPEVSVVCIESLQDTVFCAGANIFMLGQSDHSHKVNFCKFTNETRINIEEATAKSGQHYVAAVNGIAAGGGYELAIACAEIHLVDDRKSAVSLPEVPYLGVLPGTGGLTRVVDKRKVRRDLADIFCTTAEGIKGKRAVEWNLVDYVHPSSVFKEKVTERLQSLAGQGHDAEGVSLETIEAEVEGNTYNYRYVTLEIDDKARSAKITIQGPSESDSRIGDDARELGSEWYPLRMWRELRDAILQLRFNHNTVGVISIVTEGDPQHVIALDQALRNCRDHWFVREILLQQSRVLRMLDVTARTFFALVLPGACFAGSLLEIALACDRTYMLDDDDGANRISVGAVNGGEFLMYHGLSRLQNRFYGAQDCLDQVMAKEGQMLDAGEAYELGLVTQIPDDIDWEDEVRVALEERASLSPDALTGLEANLRFVGPETMESRIFARLSAWQNWIFTRPNAIGDKGALTSYGKPTNPEFDWSRV
ncbi:MAG: 2,3-epoxybenzoyl-CoA dihydrolase [Candidatus Krumholzibacteria bacterium]|nr:2,3-epoxybenzoyl-CoA dihydrolase [Candidatus Krumholzibacteria bacterium]